uniref:Diphosphomevalonate decarboxylase-like N-terminal domain-containing protein n=1 Tax=Ursus maritimus TaxID=29073 RepID=A0A452TRY0_URSMA
MASEKPLVARVGLPGWETDWLCLGLSVPGGKRDEDLVLPINSSLSVTLHQDQLKTAISKDFTEDRIWLNGREEDVGQPRLQACLRESEWGPGLTGNGSPSFQSPALLSSVLARSPVGPPHLGRAGHRSGGRWADCVRPGQNPRGDAYLLSQLVCPCAEPP